MIIENNIARNLYKKIFLSFYRLLKNICFSHQLHEYLLLRLHHQDALLVCIIIERGIHEIVPHVCSHPGGKKYLDLGYVGEGVASPHEKLITPPRIHRNAQSVSFRSILHALAVQQK